jgi:long-chain acyl-CoA synthetase
MDTESISQMIQERARRFGSKLALCSHGGDSEEKYTYRALDEASGRLATGFVRYGLEPGDRVAVLSESRPRWGTVFFATIRAGAIIVPLDTCQSANELGAVLADARPKLLLVSGGQEKTAAGLVRAYAADIKVLSIEPDSAEPAFISMDDISSSEIHTCVERKAADAAVLTYTSGTMGSAKGVVTTCGNLLYQIRASHKVMLIDSHCAAVSILPLSHLFELTAGFLGVLYGGGRVCYCNSLLPHEIVAAMREQKVTGMVTVPLFLKLFARAIRKEIEKQPLWRRSVFNVFRRVFPLLPLNQRRRLFAKLHSSFGGQLEYFVCGGAPLDIGTVNFFESIGLPVYQGYGLAETSPVIATNGPTANRTGSVGKALPGIEVKIADGGEILTRGPHVMRGYFGNDELTASVIDADGWLHTGDVGHLDRDGFLFISGREKNVIVLGSGKKVQPEELEAVLFEHPDIEEGCIIGVVASEGLMKDSEEVCAIAVASDEAVQRCAERSEDLDDTVRRVIKHQALNVSPGKRPTRIFLRTTPLPRTSTRKIRRPNVRQWLSEEAALT